MKFEVQFKTIEEMKEDDVVYPTIIDIDFLAELLNETEYEEYSNTTIL